MSAPARRAAVIIAENFEDSEATSPIEALQEAGVEVSVIGLETGTVTGKKGATVEALTTIADGHDLACASIFTEEGRYCTYYPPFDTLPDWVPQPGAAWNEMVPLVAAEVLAR